MALQDLVAKPGDGLMAGAGPEAAAKRRPRYFDVAAIRKAMAGPANRHSEFLRTGRLFRGYDSWDEVERRYLTEEEVAARTGRKLEAAGSTSHERINSFHRSIRFPKLIFHRTLESLPHLGYCHVTASRTPLTEDEALTWAFYIANFSCDIGEGLTFTNRRMQGAGRMYFAIALEADPDTRAMRFSRERGVIFKTSDPKLALKNVLTLGTSNRKLREIIASL